MEKYNTKFKKKKKNFSDENDRNRTLRTAENISSILYLYNAGVLFFVYGHSSYSSTTS